MTIRDPLAADETVVNDPATRTLAVKPAEARGHAALLWRQGHRALMKSEHVGGSTYRALVSGAAPTVWAHGAGRREIASGQPAEDGSLRFTFRRGDPTYKALVSSALRAIVVVGRESGRIMNVRFRTRRAVQVWASTLPLPVTVCVCT